MLHLKKRITSLGRLLAKMFAAIPLILVCSLFAIGFITPQIKALFPMLA